MSLNYKSQIEDIKKSLYVLLGQDQFINSYYLSKENPKNNVYKNQLLNIISNVNKKIGKMFDISVKIYQNTQSFNKKIAELRELLADEKTKNRRLKRQTGLIDTKYSTSQELIDDYIDLYDVRYVRNWAVGLGVVLILATIPKV